MLKIAVIDDHELVLDGICAQLAKEEKFDIIEHLQRLKN